MPALSKMNPDIEEERNKVSFKIEEFTNWYHKGAEKVEEKRFLGNSRTCHKYQKIFFMNSSINRKLFPLGPGAQRQRLDQLSQSQRKV